MSKPSSDQNAQTPTPRKLMASNTNVRLGIDYLKDDNVPKAKQRLLQALQDAPDNPAAWYSMGYFYEVTGDSKSADRYFKKAIAINPKSGDAHNNYGTFLCHTGHFRKAIVEFNRAAQDPGYVNVGSTYENAGLCAQFIPDKRLAVKYFKKALLQNPNSRVALYGLAQYNVRHGKQAKKS